MTNRRGETAHRAHVAPRRVRSRAVTRTEVVVVVGLVAVALSILPLVVNQAREMSRRVRCENNLRALAAANRFVGRNGAYPVGTPACGPFVIDRISDGCVGPNWIANLLEDLDLAAEHRTALDCLATTARFELDCYLAAPPGVAQGLGQVTPGMFICPTAGPLAAAGFYTGNGFSRGLNKGSYVGNFGGMPGLSSPPAGPADHGRMRGVFRHTIVPPTSFGLQLRALDRGSTLSSIDRGLSATILASEAIRSDKAADVRGAWMTTVYGGASFTTDATPNSSPLPGHSSSHHPGGVNVAWCDGGVAFAIDAIDPGIWQRSGTVSEPTRHF